MRANKSQLIKEIIKEQNKNAHFLEEEFDKAIIGTCLKYGRTIVVAYNSDDCLKVLMKKHGYCEIEAYEKFKDSLDSKNEEDNYPVFINDFRKIKITDLKDFNLTDTIDELGTNNPS